jgi:hydrogenase expression/formation protein HypC
MTVIEGDDVSALVEWGDERRRVSMALIGAQSVGTHVLVHVDMAVRVLDDAEVGPLRDALRAVVAAAQGEDFEHLLGDLVDREPELPPHLRSPQPGESS